MPHRNKTFQKIKAQSEQTVREARELNDACISDLQELTSKFIDVNKFLQDRLKHREAGA